MSYSGIHDGCPRHGNATDDANPFSVCLCKELTEYPERIATLEAELATEIGKRQAAKAMNERLKAERDELQATIDYLKGNSLHAREIILAREASQHE